MIAPNINAAEQAGKYASGGAAAISILTEPTWFKGTLNDMMVICLFFSILFPSLLLFPHIPHLEPRCTCGKVWGFRWLWSDLHCLRLCHSLSSRVFSAFLFFFFKLCVLWCFLPTMRLTCTCLLSHGSPAYSSASPPPAAAGCC